ncbi:MAG: lysylphosphatidylglycerol synthase domain-containing protein [Arenicellales bacterium]|jgi:Tol biopolymer transport system component/uncharacterized membrane protein YbhN (UPF0104 family)|nr:lysylphosphatidylglycerol synthase domain-containing protein [Arenicellales bacterium]MDP6791972.1 lysylphosphatidylglycerol synthase domain-containing protein [Arenicellales bacterium]MDP6918640.1 lysylphosphatidylglycerol synthase domain-containing protein [Arenicellales bacterium]|tara:strand:- start:440 stop:2527 length:2088 start_codon:yes stop_codon:yes gene_type:complete
MWQQPGTSLSQSLVRLTVGLTLSLLLLAALLHVVALSGSEVNLSMVFQTLKGVPLGVVLLYTLMLAANTVLRTVRYRLLLSASMGSGKISFPLLFMVTGVRNMIVDLLPARLGELIFVTMLKKACRVPISAGIATLALSFLLDIVILVPVLLLVGLLPLTESVLRQGSLPAALLLGAVITIGAIVLWPGLRAFARWSRGKTRTSGLLYRLVSFVSDVSEALTRCRQAKMLGSALGLTAAIRVLKYGGLILLFNTVVSSPGMAGAAADVADVLVALIASEVGASLPVPTLMSFGAYEAGGAAAFVLLGYPLAAAVMALLTVHIGSQALDYTLGCICLVLFFIIGAGDLGHGKTSRRISAGLWQRWRVVLAVVALLSAIGLSAYQVDRVRAARSQVAPPSGGLLAGVTDASADAATGLKGWVVWSSNRYGSHDILRMRLEDRSIDRLTQHPHTETFPRISPDGSQIVFMRSRKPWVSLRDLNDWDTYLLDLKSGQEQLLAEYAGAPTWSADGRYVYFQRRGSEFIEYALASQKERVLFRSGDGGIPAGIKLYEPSLSSRSGRLASTWRGPRRMTAIIDNDGSVQPVGKGCQLSWAPGDRFVYWVDDGGLMRNRVYRQVPGEGAPQAWLDLPAPYSHEYFPKLSRDGRYLVLGASAGGHEHDVADYEIFLWPTRAPFDQAVRLTFHSGNDNWPDIYIE